MIVYYDGFGHEETTAMRIMESGQKVRGYWDWNVLKEMMIEIQH